MVPLKDKNDLHFPDVAVQLSKRQKAAHVHGRKILLHPCDALGEETGKQVLVRDLRDRLDIVLSDVSLVRVDVPDGNTMISIKII